MILGFRSSKCKTSCKLCVSRIKLNRNKREIQVGLAVERREVAELLKSGKNEYAWIRVEAIIREKNLLAAYEILELYLELIAVRVELLEKHKSCPRDMVEAITTIMYATPRVADLPELVDVRKWLSIKFGRELGVEGGRNFDGQEPPNWQVNVKLRQYLGVEAPEPEDKLTMISSIAQECDVDFNLDTFAESVMVQLDPAIGGAPPIPQRPTNQTLGGYPQIYGGYPPQTHGVMPPSNIISAAPSAFEPDGDAPVLPPAQPSAKVLPQMPPAGSYTDAMLKGTGTVVGAVSPGHPPQQTASSPPVHPPPPGSYPDVTPLPPPADLTFSPPALPQEKSFVRIQQQYDDIPSPPNKAVFDEEEEPEEPTAPPASTDHTDLPTPPPSYPQGGLDSDLSRRLSELRKR